MTIANAGATRTAWCRLTADIAPRVELHEMKLDKAP